jgi:hypothetical protein
MLRNKWWNTHMDVLTALLCCGAHISLYFILIRGAARIEPIKHSYRIEIELVISLSCCVRFAAHNQLVAIWFYVWISISPNVIKIIRLKQLSTWYERKWTIFVHSKLPKWKYFLWRHSVSHFESDGINVFRNFNHMITKIKIWGTRLSKDVKKFAKYQLWTKPD